MKATMRGILHSCCKCKGAAVLARSLDERLEAPRDNKPQGSEGRSNSSHLLIWGRGFSNGNPSAQQECHLQRLVGVRLPSRRPLNQKPKCRLLYRSLVWMRTTQGPSNEVFQ